MQETLSVDIMLRTAEMAVEKVSSASLKFSVCASATGQSDGAQPVCDVNFALLDLFSTCLRSSVFDM